MKTLSSKFYSGRGGIRASVVTFSSYADLSIKFNEYNKAAAFSEAVDNIPLMGLQTRIDKALRLTQTKMFTKQHGARIGVPRVIILLTDGSQTWNEGAEDPVVIAKELRKLGIRIIVVGIGDEIKYSELNGIAGKNNRVFTADSFDQLISEEFIQKISSNTCDYGKFLIQYIW